MRAPSSTALSPAHAAEPGRELLVAVDPGPLAGAFASSLRERVAPGIDGHAVTVLVATPPPDVVLVEPADPRAAPRAPDVAGIAAGGVPGRRSALGALLREADRRGAAVAALVIGAGRDEDVDWLRLLVSPLLEGAFEFVSPAYRRLRLDGLLGTAILYPLTRALYGFRLRQPAGGEAALSLALARHLLADLDWRRDPERAGSDAWLVAKALSERRRVCQAWLGRWPGDGDVAEDASHALARLVGPVFVEMERRAEHWQRVDGSEPVASLGDATPPPDAPGRVDVAALSENFRLGLRELDGVWGLVLPPATRLALRRAAAAPGAPRLADSLWARVVYDFAVAHYTRTVERGQLLRSLTPLYLGWVAGFVEDVLALDGAATEARVEALCVAFEREKRYLIGRWRWPDGFNP